MWELMHIFRDYDVKSGLRVLNLSYFKYLHVVTHHIVSHLERRDIDDIHEGILDTEDAADLSVLTLQELLHGYAFHLTN